MRIKPRRIFEPFFVNIEHEGILVRLGLGKGTPWNRKQLFPHTQKASERDHGIRNAPGGAIDHDIFDIAQVLSLRILYISTDECIAPDQAPGELSVLAK